MTPQSSQLTTHDASGPSHRRDTFPHPRSGRPMPEPELTKASLAPTAPGRDHRHPARLLTTYRQQGTPTRKVFGPPVERRLRTNDLRRVMPRSVAAAP